MSQGRDRLKQIRNNLGLSQSTLDKIMSFKDYTVNNIEGGKQKLSAQVAIALREKIAQTPDGRLRIVTPENPRREDEAQLRFDWLMTGDGEPFEKTLKSANSFEFAYKDEQITLPKDENILFYSMPDDSMLPEFSKKDYIAIDKNQNTIKNGGVYLISVFDEDLLRRIFKTGKNKLTITSINKDLVPSFEIDESEVKITGKAIYKITILQ